HPGIKITLADQHNESLLEALSQGDVDAAIVGLTGQPLPPEIRTRSIGTEPLVVGVPASHELSRRSVVSLKDLREWPIITLTQGSGLRAVLEDSCHEVGFTPRIIAEASELSLLVELAAEGLGAAILPRSAVSDDRLATVEITRPCLQRHTAL